METTIQKIDDNYVINLPANIINRIKMKDCEIVQVFEEYGRIVIQKAGMSTIANDPKRKTIEELFEGYDGDYMPIEIDWGKPIGKEIW